MATQDRLHVQHYYTTGTSAPSPSNLELGEIAVGTNPNKPCVYFRDTNNNVHTLTEGKNYLDKTITGTTQEVKGNVKFNSGVEFYHNVTADTIIANYVNENPLILQYTDDDMLDGNSIISLSGNSMNCTVKTSSNETNLSISDSSLTYTMNVDAGGSGTITFGVDELDGAYIEINNDKVSVSGHTHSANSITSGQFNIARIPTGTTSTTVARGDHGHSANSITSGQFNIARIPTGITSTTVARGNHGHSNYLTLNGGTLTGALTAPAFYETSDERLKTFEEDIDVDFEKLSKLRKSVYFLNDDDLAIRHIGMSAQEVYEVYPQLIDVRKDTTEQYMSLDYSKLSVVALKAIDKLYETNQKLEERVKMLEEKLMSLGNN